MLVVVRRNSLSAMTLVRTSHENRGGLKKPKAVKQRVSIRDKQPTKPVRRLFVLLG